MKRQLTPVSFDSFSSCIRLAGMSGADDRQHLYVIDHRKIFVGACADAAAKKNNISLSLVFANT